MSLVPDVQQPTLGRPGQHQPCPRGTSATADIDCGLHLNDLQHNKKPQGDGGLEVRLGSSDGKAASEPYGRRLASASNNSGNRFANVITRNLQPRLRHYCRITYTLVDTLRVVKFGGKFWRPAMACHARSIRIALIVTLQDASGDVTWGRFVTCRGLTFCRASAGYKPAPRSGQ